MRNILNKKRVTKLKIHGSNISKGENIYITINVLIFVIKKPYKNYTCSCLFK